LIKHARIYDVAFDVHVPLKVVCQLTGLSVTQILGDGWKNGPDDKRRKGLVEQGLFPKPFRTSPRGKWMWWLSDILKWMEEQSKKFPWTPPHANDNRPSEEEPDDGA
jgi:predicted DNA-binding transcriptional regulator AlpA